MISLGFSRLVNTTQFCSSEEGNSAGGMSEQKVIQSAIRSSQEEEGDVVVSIPPGRGATRGKLANGSLIRTVISLQLFRRNRHSVP